MKHKIYLIVTILFFFLQVLNSQNTNKKVLISGVIRDYKNAPVEGALIFIDDKNTNSKTNKEGYYKVKVNASSKKISVFLTTGETSEATIDGRKAINFVMVNEYFKPLEEPTLKENFETVSDGYNTTNKYDYPGSVSKIDGQKSKYKSYQNIYDMMRGELAGVRVVGTKIQIMGPSSFNSNDEPIFILDGVEVNKIDDIAPNQIKSIEVLKGADAAIYGTRGGNGVIVIKLLSAKDYK